MTGYTLIKCFGDLQNYTTLKQVRVVQSDDLGFGDLQNYTTLKPCLMTNVHIAGFWRFTELHYSQTKGLDYLHHPQVLEIYRITLLSNRGTI